MPPARSIPAEEQRKIRPLPVSLRRMGKTIRRTGEDGWGQRRPRGIRQALRDGERNARARALAWPNGGSESRIPFAAARRMAARGWSHEQICDALARKFALPQRAARAIADHALGIDHYTGVASIDIRTLDELRAVIAELRAGAVLPTRRH
jgi:hypothetical protein